MKLKDFDFRIWDKKYKEYIFTNRTISKYYKDASTVTSLAGRIRKEKYSGNLVFDDLGCDCEECEIELFTGLYDKNRRKIYENDIVSYETLQGKTLFYFVTINKDINIFEIFRIANLEKFELYNRTENDRFSLYLFSKINDMKDIEVIGNIHNKAELLEVKELK
ncbi:hypothetical protein LW861_001836 [Campylobacter jejuni]|nr:hypothetical protein [Campylobacter jejuni]EJW2497839.1 hypothetical protein [Campylobacter jejuni]